MKGKKKVIRQTYPAQFSIGLLLLIFIVSFFLSHQIFKVPMHQLDENINVYYGMFLVSVAVLIMILIMWEEILFPIKLKESQGGIIFHNHRKKLRAQLLMYCCIPAIFGFIYYEYDVRLIRFILWAVVCMVPPVIEKIVSGINNYNDFLKLTDNTIEYRNNEKEGSFDVVDIQHITIVNDERNIIEKIQLAFSNKESVTIDLDEMELDAFYASIDGYMRSHYAHLVK